MTAVDRGAPVAGGEPRPALEVTGLAVEFPGERGERGERAGERAGSRAVVRAVAGASFSVQPGETVALVGESGSGKSVSALAVMGLLDPPGRVVGGEVRVGGQPVLDLREAQWRTLRGRRIAMVFQDPMTSLNPTHRIGRQVAEAIRVHDHAATKADAQRRAVVLLERVGLVAAGERARDYPHQLSGGQRQRVMLAMAIANRPDVLIADEPTTALDVTTQAQILELLRDLQQEMGLALLLITHDLGVVAGIADRVVVMYAGRVVEEGPVDAVFAHAAHPYTRALLASVPRTGDQRGGLRAIAGSPPDPGTVLAGCAFAPRCPLAEDRCREQVPDLRGVGEQHRVACVFGDQIATGRIVP
jgi:oligopeptide/dipeptide ABC transporter ATP-binding protein